MRRDEAARLLGVSSKTLYRLERSGKLPARKKRTGKGQVIEYDPRDLEQLRLERLKADTVTPVAAECGPQPMKRVTFGLPPEDYEDLAGEAKGYGLKPGEYARRLMREALESNLRAEIRDVRTLGDKTAADVRRLRSEVASAVEALLEYLNLSPEEARTWVASNLR